MSKPSSCKYCDNRVECDKSYKRYVHEGTEHKCFYELKNDNRFYAKRWRANQKARAALAKAAGESEVKK